MLIVPTKVSQVHLVTKKILNHSWAFPSKRKFYKFLVILVKIFFRQIPSISEPLFVSQGFTMRQQYHVRGLIHLDKLGIVSIIR